MSSQLIEVMHVSHGTPQVNEIIKCGMLLCYVITIQDLTIHLNCPLLKSSVNTESATTMNLEEIILPGAPPSAQDMISDSGLDK